MNGILIILILIILNYFIYKKLKKKIYNKEVKTLGVLQNDYNIKKYGFLLKQKLNFNIELIMYEDYDKLMNDLNNEVIDFGITYENYFIDSILGLNTYENKFYKNLNFCSGLYFNYFQFLSNIFVKDTQTSIKFTNITDLKDFKKVKKRNYILGTENIKSISFINMFILLVSFDFNPINYSKYDENIDYDDNIIFYYISDENTLKKKLLEDELDGLLLFRTFNDKIISSIDNEKDVLFLNIDFNNTYFDELFSLYFFKNKNILVGVNEFVDIYKNKYYETDDFRGQTSYETRMARVVLITNKNLESDIVYEMMKVLYGHNNYFMNVLTNSNNTLESEHNLFEPIQLAYVDKNIPIHDGAKKFFKEIGFIIENERIIKDFKLNNNEKLKCYWKYKKIGLSNFEL